MGRRQLVLFRSRHHDPHRQRTSRGRWRSLAPPVILLVFLVTLSLAYYLVSYPLLFSATTTTTSSLPLSLPQQQHQQQRAQQYVRYNKRGKEVMHRIDRVRVTDLRDLTDDPYLMALLRNNQSLSTINNDHEASTAAAAALADKKVLLDELYRSGIRDIDAPTIQLLPTWSEVAQLYYRHVDSKHNSDKAIRSSRGGATGDGDCEPIIFGLDKCRAFARRSAPNEAFLATAGLYNTGTNALTYYLRANLHMPGNPLYDGILVQVPWHKHWFVNQRDSHSIPYLSNISHANVLPIVTIRDPLTWAQSMCDQPYDVEWTATGKSKAPPTCPAVTKSRSSGGDGDVKTDASIIRIPKQTGTKTYQSLWDFYNAWYEAYLNDANGLDFVMVRHEDLLYCPSKVIAAIQACSQAQWNAQDNFVYVVDQAKWEHARLSGRAQSNRVSAMIKHGHPHGRRIRHLSMNDIRRSGLNTSLLEMYGYHLPDSLPF